MLYNGMKVVLKVLWIGQFLILVGCAGNSLQNRWGADAYKNANANHLKTVSKDSLTDSLVLFPALAGLALLATDYDKKISNWATKHTPIYGSMNNAKNYSNNFKHALLAGTVLTGLLTPSGDNFKEWGINKTKGFSVLVLAYATSGILNFAGKRTAQRLRPDKSNRYSFPSGHSTAAGSLSYLSNQNIENLNIPIVWKASLITINTLMTVGTLWGRVEGKKHYPSDVLVGYAVGRFASSFVYNLFMDNSNIQKQSPLSINIFTNTKETYANMELSF